MVIVQFKRPVCCCHFMTGLVPVGVDVLFIYTTQVTCA